MSVLKELRSIKVFDHTRFASNIRAERIIVSYNTSEFIKKCIERGTWYVTVFEPNPDHSISSDNILVLNTEYVIGVVKRIWQDEKDILGDVDVWDSRYGAKYADKFESDEIIFIPRMICGDEDYFKLITFDARWM